MAKNKFYSYILVGSGEKGVLNSWPKCQQKIKGHKARYKGFPTEREATSWLEKGGVYEEKTDKYYGCFFLNSNSGVIVNTWSQCKELTKKEPSRYKSFKTKKEAQHWIDNGGAYESKESIQKNLPDAIYFDAGTGRGIGTEVRVTDKFGNSILDKLVPKDKINEFGNYLTEEGSTNNFGELLGCYIALKIAISEKILEIYGDSQLVIKYWSNGHIKKENVNEVTFELSKKVAKLKENYTKLGGEIKHISGDINPADLGFHK